MGMMTRVYYDESGEYDGDGNILNMTVGACVFREERWSDFDKAWIELLGKYGLTDFHMAHFQAWKGQFDFQLADGSRDKERHNRLMDEVLALLLEYSDGFYGYAAVSAAFPERERSHEILMDDCVCGAIKEAVLRIAPDNGTPLHLIFGRQSHISEAMIGKYVDFYDYEEAKGRIGKVEHLETASLSGLQAADVLAYELARVQRDGRPERYPWKRLVEGAKAAGKTFTMTWGPIRSKRSIFSGSGTGWGD
jgi:hypothetical protein